MYCNSVFSTGNIHISPCVEIYTSWCGGSDNILDPGLFFLNERTSLISTKSLVTEREKNVFANYTLVPFTTRSFNPLAQILRKQIVLKGKDRISQHFLSFSNSETSYFMDLPWMICEFVPM